MWIISDSDLIEILHRAAAGADSPSAIYLELYANGHEEPREHLLP